MKVSEIVSENRKKKPVSKSALTSQIASLHGKVPPQAVDLEEAVLGAMMIEKDALTDVIGILKPECFYKEAHQKIYGVIYELFHNNEPVDILTVTQALRKKNELEIVGGPYAITQLTNRIASAANIEFHARIIQEKYIQRELIRTSTEVVSLAYEDTTDVLELLDQAERNLFSIAEGNIRGGTEDISSLITHSLEEIKKAGDKPSGVTGVESGFTELDRLTAGWQKGDLIIVAARPGMGKTAFVLSLARNAAVRFKRPVAFFSLEMSSLQLVNRLISAETELNHDKIRKGQLQNHEWQQLYSKITPLTQSPVYIDDVPALSIFELRAKCRRLVAEHGIQLIIVDYLQLMTSGSEKRNSTREQEISSISHSLKSIAKELKVPVIAISQLSRDVEKRQATNKRPLLSDLRESGAIEQDADLVLFIYREEYYFQEDADPESRNAAEIIVAKNRNGTIGDIKLKFIGALTKFVEPGAVTFEGQPELGLAPENDRITIRSKMDDEQGEPLPF